MTGEGLVFGRDVLCGGCHGVGERVLKMTAQEKRERGRELSRARRARETVVRIPVTKSCPECDGRGYLPALAADVPRP